MEFYAASSSTAFNHCKIVASTASMQISNFFWKIQLQLNLPDLVLTLLDETVLMLQRLVQQNKAIKYPTLNPVHLLNCKVQTYQWTLAVAKQDIILCISGETNTLKKIIL